MHAECHAKGFAADVRIEGEADPLLVVTDGAPARAVATSTRVAGSGVVNERHECNRQGSGVSRAALARARPRQA